MDKYEFKSEQEHLKQILDLLKKKRKEVEARLPGKRQNLLSARSEMWEDAPHNIRSFDDVVEFHNYNQNVYEKSKRYTDDIEELRRTDSLICSPYFGRFDFKVDGSDEYEPIYIGKYSFYSKTDTTHYIYDWRAPISSIYYEYDIGRVSYSSPGGIYHGDVGLKRQYKIKNSKIEYMFDAETTVQDEILGRILAENTDSKLKVIISSIQREQNAAIRNLTDKYVLIYGPAGSGKTSVGLHRLAYMLYHKRHLISSKNIVVLSNNGIYNSYISSILPELGEADVSRQVFSDMIKKYMPSGFKLKNYYEQADSLIDENRESRKKEIELKYSPEFISYIESYFKAFEFTLPEIVYNGNVVLSNSDFAALWDRQKREFRSFPSLLLRLYKIIKEHCENYFKANKTRLLNDIEKSSDEFLSTEKINAIYKRELDVLVSSSKKLLLTANRINSVFLLSDILKSYISKYNLDIHISKITDEFLENRILRYEDCLAIMYIRLLIGEIKPNINAYHVLIDEAQDCGFLQMCIIRKLYPNSSFTLLSDINQAVNSYTSIMSYEEMDRVFDYKLKRFYLSKSYRSSGPINMLALQLIKKYCDEDIESSYFKRSGDQPRYIVSNNFAGEIRDILDAEKPLGRITAVITRTVKEAKSLYKHFKDNEDVQLIDAPDREMKKRIMIIPAMFSKGLEFDTVIAVNCAVSTGNERLDRNMLYLICTRALHSLYIIADSQLPPMFEDCRPYLNFSC